MAAIGAARLCRLKKNVDDALRGETIDQDG